MTSGRKRVIEMSAEEARNFFLKKDSYASLLLPEYFNFQPVLDFAVSQLENNDLSSIINRQDLRADENANYTILLNKNAGYDWRPVQIVHPFLYVDLVQLITQRDNWKELVNRFKKFQSDSKIECISIPVGSTGDKNDAAEVILNWWEEMEQNSIVKSLQFSYCIKTDITNCYGSIYTHTIDWAIRGKEQAKQGKKGHDKSFGHKLDLAIEDLQCGQTNGIPQGGPLFDFIAEIVLGYSDLLLSERLAEEKITDWSIVRYRDDYRIFSNSKEVAEQVIKELSDILSGLNMHFNNKKTGLTQEIIESAIKPDKIYWNSRIPVIMPNVGAGNKKKIKYQMNLQKHLLEVLWLSKRYPNSGSINKALTAFARRLDEQNKVTESVLPLISIAADIVANNPRAIPSGVGVLSKLLIKSDTADISAVDLVEQLTVKLENTPNLNYLDVWLQRLAIQAHSSQAFSEGLCKAVIDSQFEIWDSSFFSSTVNLPKIVDEEVISSVHSEISTNVFDIFTEYL